MKSISKILFLAICLITSDVKSQDSINNSFSSINKARLTGVSVGQGTVISLSGIGLYSLWYSNKQNSNFHFFNDFGNWKNMDKVGHLYSSYHISRSSSKLFEWSGLNSEKSMWIGSSIGLGFQTMIEIMDGFNSGWGFSISDMGSNILGVGLFISQEKLFNEQLFMPKFSYHPTSYANLRPEVLGKSHSERLIKDYNGQTYWLSFSPKIIFKNSKMPEWFCFSIGYSVDKKLIGNSDIFVNTNSTFYAKKEFLFSLDIDFNKISCKNKFLKIILGQLNYLKIPFPTISYSKNIFHFHPLYF